MPLSSSMAPLGYYTGLIGSFLLLALLWPHICFAQNIPADFCSTLNTASGSASELSTTIAGEALGNTNVPFKT